MPTPALLIRPSTPADLPAITAIYAEAVLHGTGTFETEPPDEAEMARRRSDVLAKGLPQENRHRILEPYMTMRDKGTGLGLAIV